MEFQHAGSCSTFANRGGGQSLGFEALQGTPLVLPAFPDSLFQAEFGPPRPCIVLDALTFRVGAKSAKKLPGARTELWISSLAAVQSQHREQGLQNKSPTIERQQLVLIGRNKQIWRRELVIFSRCLGRDCWGKATADLD